MRGETGRRSRSKSWSNPDDLRFLDIDTDIEAATNVRKSLGQQRSKADTGYSSSSNQAHPSSSSVKRRAPQSLEPSTTKTLTPTSLLVVGLSHPDDEDHAEDFMELARRAREGKPIHLREIQELSKKEPLTFLDEKADLVKAIETFGRRGVHRVVVRNETTDQATGVLSQTRLVRFLWENGRSFPMLDQIYLQNLR